MGLKKFADNLGIDEEDFRELTQLFIDTTKSDLEKLSSSIDEDNYQKAREAAHSIKGAAGNLGFMDIWESASVCEKAAVDSKKEIIRSKKIEISDLLDKISGLV